jgi:pimeloyl-ACP methyl ester carboxylesterase
MTDFLPTNAQAHLIDLPGGRFRYLTWGVDETSRPDLLLLHGITSSALSWVRVGPALADRYRVFALDMRGHGKSVQSPSGTYSLRQTADDAADLIAALGMKNPVVIGHSWGGATAVVLASGAWSERSVPTLARVILEDPAYAIGQGDVEARIDVYTRDIGRPAEELRRELPASSPGWTEDDIEGKIEALQQVTKTAVISVFQDARETPDLLPLLAQIAAPTLLLRADGAKDTTMNNGAWARAQTYLTSSSRGIEIAGATHNIHRSMFEAFMEAVNDFLTER